MSKKNTFNVDRILGLSAMVISLLTLMIFVYQTNIIHTQSRLSVEPRLSFASSNYQNDTITTFNISLQNKGIGPAIINDAKVILRDGQTAKLDMSDFWRKYFPELHKYGTFRTTSSAGKGTTLSADETKVLFSYEFKNSKVDSIQYYLNLDENGGFPFNIEIIYSSIYNEKWMIDYKTNEHPIKL